MSRKRCKRRVVPMGALPLVYGSLDSGRRNAALMAHSALDMLLLGLATHKHVVTLIQIAAYVSSMCELLLRSATVDQEELVDAIEAANDGSAAIIRVQERMSASGHIGAQGVERTALSRLVEAHEAIVRIATRRESSEALRRFSEQAARV